MDSTLTWPFSTSKESYRGSVEGSRLYSLDSVSLFVECSECGSRFGVMRVYFVEFIAFISLVHHRTLDECE